MEFSLKNIKTVESQNSLKASFRRYDLDIIPFRTYRFSLPHFKEREAQFQLTNVQKATLSKAQGYQNLETKCFMEALSACIYRRFALENLKGLQQITLEYNQYSDVWRGIYPEKSKNFKSIESLVFVFNDNQEVEDRGLNLWTYHVTSWAKDIKKFTLQLEKCNNITTFSLRKICSDICKYMKRIECLTLNVYRCNNVDANDGIISFMTSYYSRYLKRLQTLNLVFSGVADKGIQHLNFSRRYLEKLQHFVFYLDARRVIPTHVLLDVNIGPLNIKQVPNKLSLFIVDLDSFTRMEDCFGKFTSKLFCHLKSLTTLELYFEKIYNIQTPQEKFDAYIECLNTLMPRLENLKLRLSLCDRMTGKMMKNLRMNQGNKLKTLEVFVGAYELQKSENGSVHSEEDENDLLLIDEIKREYKRFIQPFCQNFLQNLKNLTVLKIELSCIEIRNSEAFELCSSIMKNLTNLVCLNVKFYWIPTLTDDVFLSLETVFSSFKLEHLKDLTLSFSYCQEITEIQAKSFETRLKGVLAHLNNLEFHYDE